MAIMTCLLVGLCFQGVLHNTAIAEDDVVGVFPKKDYWFQASPSVVWFGDKTSTTTIEVHFPTRKDIARVWMTRLGTTESEGRLELFDDGTYGDTKAGDFIFTRSDIIPYANISWFVDGKADWLGFLRVELKDGTYLGCNAGLRVGMVQLQYKNAFPVTDFGNGLSATPYAFFIEDSKNEVINDYPVADVYCGTKNYTAYKKLYSVFPDVFDFVTLMPGMQLFQPKNFGENVPYCVTASNRVKNIGLPIVDNTKEFGSQGRLIAAIYTSFGTIDINDHEIGHAWMAAAGKKLGLIQEKNISLGHWNEMTDIAGQMAYYYFDDSGVVGHFAYNGDETWHFISNFEVEPYSPLELYCMGLIPSSEIPDIHILKNPDMTDLNRITVQSYKTVTAAELVKSMGGERIPSWEESQKDFNMAFIVTQDVPYNDAAYAYFSLFGKVIMDQPEPRWTSSYAPFFWATGQRATINTLLCGYGVLNGDE
ncbi:MAG: hypothetical protein JW811_05890 [Clostridiales bacterium]|nr:hypothetical protein [Clostridiales bacterium]